MRDFLDPYGFKMPEIVGSGVTPYVFSAEYQAVYDSFVVKPAADIAQQQDIMVRALVSGGVWAVLDVFRIYANNTAVNAVLNWVNLGNFDATEVNAPTFLAYRHYVGNGVNQRLDWSYNPTLHATSYLQNSCSFGCYIRNNTSEAGYDVGTNAAVDAYFRVNSGGTLLYRVNDATNDLGGNADSRGFYVATRTAANQKLIYRNAALVTPLDATVSTGLPNTLFTTMCRGGSNDGFTIRQYACDFAGGGMTQALVTAFTNALETYLDYIGAGVIP